MVYRLLCRLLASANIKQVDSILKASVKRREELAPDWEMVYIALPKNDRKLRGEMLEKMLQWADGKPGKDSCF